MRTQIEILFWLGQKRSLRWILYHELWRLPLRTFVKISFVSSLKVYLGNISITTGLKDLLKVNYKIKAERASRMKQQENHITGDHLTPGVTITTTQCCHYLAHVPSVTTDTCGGDTVLSTRLHHSSSRFVQKWGILAPNRALGIISLWSQKFPYSSHLTKPKYTDFKIS